MKKYIGLLLCVFLMPMFAFAADKCNQNEIQIKNLKLTNRENSAYEVEPASVQNNEIQTNLDFFEVGDSIVYEFVIKNNSAEDFVINQDSVGIDSPYIQYDIKILDGNYLIQPGKEKKVQLNITYKNPVSNADYQNGSFQETNMLSFQLKNGSHNPITSPNYMIVLVVLIVMTISILFLHKRSQKALLVILGIVITPLLVKAVCETSILVNSNVSIMRCNYRFVTDVGTFSETEDLKEICVNELNMNDKTYPMGYCNSNCTHSKVRVLPADFHDNSFVKVYDADNNLMKTITKDDFSENQYSITSGDFLDELFTPFIFDKYPVHLEVSDDLEDCNYYAEAFTYDHVYYSIEDGPWITDPTSLHQMEVYMKSIMDSDEEDYYCFRGFVNIESNIYHDSFRCMAS